MWTAAPDVEQRMRLFVIVTFDAAMVTHPSMSSPFRTVPGVVTTRPPLERRVVPAGTPVLDESGNVPAIAGRAADAVGLGRAVAVGEGVTDCDGAGWLAVGLGVAVGRGAGEAVDEAVGLDAFPAVEGFGALVEEGAACGSACADLSTDRISGCALRNARIVASGIS